VVYAIQQQEEDTTLSATLNKYIFRSRLNSSVQCQQDLRSNNLSLDEAITVAQNRPLWRLMSAFGATHP